MTSPFRQEHRLAQQKRKPQSSESFQEVIFLNRSHDFPFLFFHNTSHQETSTNWWHFDCTNCTRRFTCERVEAPVILMKGLFAKLGMTAVHRMNCWPASHQIRLLRTSPSNLFPHSVPMPFIVSQKTAIIIETELVKCEHNFLSINCRAFRPQIKRIPCCHNAISITCSFHDFPMNPRKQLNFV